MDYVGVTFRIQKMNCPAFGGLSPVWVPAKIRCHCAIAENRKCRMLGLLVQLWNTEIINDVKDVLCSDATHHLNMHNGIPEVAAWFPWWRFFPMGGGGQHPYSPWGADGQQPYSPWGAGGQQQNTNPPCSLTGLAQVVQPTFLNPTGPNSATAADITNALVGAINTYLQCVQNSQNNFGSNNGMNNGFGGVSNNGFGGVSNNGFGGVPNNGFGGAPNNGFGGVPNNGVNGVPNNGVNGVPNNGVPNNFNGAPGGGPPFPNSNFR